MASGITLELSLIRLTSIQWTKHPTSHQWFIDLKSIWLHIPDSCSPYTHLRQHLPAPSFAKLFPSRGKAGFYFGFITTFPVCVRSASTLSRQKQSLPCHQIHSASTSIGSPSSRATRLLSNVLRQYLTTNRAQWRQLWETRPYDNITICPPNPLALWWTAHRECSREALFRTHEPLAFRPVGVFHYDNFQETLRKLWQGLQFGGD